jgi:hypothetical protein
MTDSAPWSPTPAEIRKPRLATSTSAGARGVTDENTHGMISTLPLLSVILRRVPNILHLSSLICFLTGPLPAPPREGRKASRAHRLPFLILALA